MLLVGFPEAAGGKQNVGLDGALFGLMACKWPAGVLWELGEGHIIGKTIGRCELLLLYGRFRVR